jgi:transposase InsO family protein
MTDMKTGKEGPRGHHHLAPLEIQAIADARAHGAKVAALAEQYGVSRQTIYNAARAAKDVLAPIAGGGGALPAKRHRAKRVTPEAERGIVDLKAKYPTWGVDYLREQWAKGGHAPLSRASIYRILHGAGLQTRRGTEKATYERFEMTRPGQLWHVDIQGKIYLPGIGWVYGFAVLDDFSRYCPAFRYFPDEKLSNGILVLNAAIAKYGVPEAVYVDNGAQFKSRGERLNNFELFCGAHAIQVVTSTPYRPQGKGKIERFFETEENQFIGWARAKVAEDPAYTLTVLNRDLEAYLQDKYHARVHGTTKQTPVERFTSGHLREPDPPVDVTKFLERSMDRRVNKFGEVSFGGYKIQVDLPARARVTVVETIETVRLEYGAGLVREVNKHDLSKDAPVKRQDGVKDYVTVPRAKGRTCRKTEHHSHAPDEAGYYHRMVSPGGNVKLRGVSHYIGIEHAGKNMLLKVAGNLLRVFDTEHHPLGRVEVRRGRRY